MVWRVEDSLPEPDSYPLVPTAWTTFVLASFFLDVGPTGHVWAKECLEYGPVESEDLQKSCCFSHPLHLKPQGLFVLWSMTSVVRREQTSHSPYPSTASESPTPIVLEGLYADKRK